MLVLKLHYEKKRKNHKIGETTSFRLPPPAGYLHRNLLLEHIPDI